MSFLVIVAPVVTDDTESRDDPRLWRIMEVTSVSVTAEDEVYTVHGKYVPEDQGVTRHARDILYCYQLFEQAFHALEGARQRYNEAGGHVGALERRLANVKDDRNRSVDRLASSTSIHLKDAITRLEGLDKVEEESED